MLENSNSIAAKHDINPDHMMKLIPENYLATLCLLFSASMWGLIWYPLRLLEQAGMSAVWVSLVMYLSVIVVSLPWMIKRKLFSQITPDLLGLALAAGVTSVCFLMALIEGEVMRVMLLLYLSPIWSVLLSRWWLGERLSAKAVLMFCLAVLGSVVMLWNPDIGFPWPNGLGDWLAIMSSIAFSFNNVLSRKLSQVSMTLKVGATWWGVFLVSAAVVLFQQSLVPNVESWVWGVAIALGIFGMIAVNISTLYGLAKMPVYRSSVIMLFELVVGALSAWWLSNELMSGSEWLGGAFIIIAAYGVARSEQTS
jgi:drug/metabolite transporter (DMT)-like permease